MGVGPYIVLVGKHDDGPGVGRLQQPSDDLVELSNSGLPRDLQGLGDAHPPCRTHRETGRPEQRRTGGGADCDTSWMEAILPQTRPINTATVSPKSALSVPIVVSTLTSR